MSTFFSLEPPSGPVHRVRKRRNANWPRLEPLSPAYIPPVPGATVAVTQRAGGGRHTLLALRVTDENGRTAPIRVATPEPSASESPGTESPFAVCDIWVEVPGYEMLLVENVQVFPNTESLQELELIPLPEQTSSSTRGEIVDIPPQDL